MRTAFNVENMSGLNQLVERAERQALSDVFAGAMGLYRNPPGHKNNVVMSPEEAAKLLIYASYLLDVAEEQANKAGLKAP